MFRWSSTSGTPLRSCTYEKLELRLPCLNFHFQVSQNSASKMQICERLSRWEVTVTSRSLSGRKIQCQIYGYTDCHWHRSSDENPKNLKPHLTFWELLGKMKYDQPLAVQKKLASSEHGFFKLGETTQPTLSRNVPVKVLPCRKGKWNYQICVPSCSASFFLSSYPSYHHPMTPISVLQKDFCSMGLFFLNIMFSKPSRIISEKFRKGSSPRQAEN